MPSADYRVTIVFDYTAQWDDGNEPPDLDYLHDAIRDSFDNIDLEFDTEAPVYDEDGDETDDTYTVNVNADNLREVEVIQVDARKHGWG